ncbi:MAG: glycosyltransferase family 2 protein [Phycisphaerales bacterium]|jgi:dolichol-phosphate mannosyltransferase|nr:glycosyltransferase family 2 protein [Phycisphaeraceae bacterium]
MADADQDDPAGDANSASTPGGPTLSVVAPAHNEAENIAQLVEQTGRALSVAGVSFELIIVDDGSTDATRTRIAEHMPTRPWLRGLSMRQTPPGKGNGQSAAFHAGIRAARGVFIATIDADLQNDPADLPAMLELSRERNADFVQGDRSHARRDNFIRRASSRVGRFFRRLILRDVVRDTGCSLRIMRRQVALRLPLEFRGVHRFMPFLAHSMGYVVVEMPVRHRERAAGVSKYGMGITQRAIPGLIDCFAIRWMTSRRRGVLSADITTAPARPGRIEQIAANSTSHAASAGSHA